MYMADKRSVNNYYVDEAGDLTLFNRRGHVIVGREGVSKVFMVGVAYLPDPRLAYLKLEKLRTDLLTDTYFRNVPSMQPKNEKTAVTFMQKTIFRKLDARFLNFCLILERRSKSQSGERII